jgi:hypothetical protein
VLLVNQKVTPWGQQHPLKDATSFVKDIRSDQRWMVDRITLTAIVDAYARAADAAMTDIVAQATGVLSKTSKAR